MDTINIVGNIPIEEIEYSKLEFDQSNNCYKSKLMFKGKKICVETPTLLFYDLKKMSSKHKHHRMIVTFKNEPDSHIFYKWFRELELKHVNYLMASEMFSEAASLDADFELLFQSDIIPSMKLNDINQMNVYLPVVNNEITTAIHDQTNKSVPVTDILRGYPIKLVLCCEYVCFEAERFYAHWTVDELSILGTIVDEGQELFKDEMDEIVPVAPVVEVPPTAANSPKRINEDIPEVLSSDIKKSKKKKNDVVVMSNPLFIKNIFNESTNEVNYNQQRHSEKPKKKGRQKKSNPDGQKKAKTENKKRKRKLKDIIHLRSDKSITTLK
jgi:hypothetical protein